MITRSNGGRCTNVCGQPRTCKASMELSLSLNCTFATISSSSSSFSFSQTHTHTCKTLHEAEPVPELHVLHHQLLILRTAALRCHCCRVVCLPRESVERLHDEQATGDQLWSAFVCMHVFLCTCACVRVCVCV